MESSLWKSRECLHPTGASYMFWTYIEMKDTIISGKDVCRLFKILPTIGREGLLCVCVCVHFGVVRRCGNGIFWGNTVYMSKDVYVVVKKNHPALGHDRKVIFPVQVFLKIAL